MELQRSKKELDAKNNLSYYQIPTKSQAIIIVSSERQCIQWKVCRQKRRCPKVVICDIESLTRKKLANFPSKGANVLGTKPFLQRLEPKLLRRKITKPE